MELSLASSRFPLQVIALWSPSMLQKMQLAKPDTSKDAGTSMTSAGSPEAIV